MEGPLGRLDQGKWCILLSLEGRGAEIISKSGSVELLYIHWSSGLNRSDEAKLTFSKPAKCEQNVGCHASRKSAMLIR